MREKCIQLEQLCKQFYDGQYQFHTYTPPIRLRMCIRLPHIVQQINRENHQVFIFMFISSFIILFLLSYAPLFILLFAMKYILIEIALNTFHLRLEKSFRYMVWFEYLYHISIVNLFFLFHFNFLFDFPFSFRFILKRMLNKIHLQSSGTLYPSSTK